MGLAYERGVDLAFDTDAFRDAAENFKDVSDELEGLNNDLNKLLTELSTSGWTTQAGRAFQKMVEQDWSTALTRYCDLLKTLSDILNHAATDYETLVDNDVLTLTMA